MCNNKVHVKLITRTTTIYLTAVTSNRLISRIVPQNQTVVCFGIAFF